MGVKCRNDLPFAASSTAMGRNEDVVLATPSPTLNGEPSVGITQHKTTFFMGPGCPWRGIKPCLTKFISNEFVAKHTQGRSLVLCRCL